MAPSFIMAYLAILLYCHIGINNLW